MSSTTHYPFTLPPQWRNNRTYIHDEDAWASINGWLNSVRWTDDTLRDLILGFRERGLEDDTLFVMYLSIMSAVILMVATEITLGLS